MYVFKSQVLIMLIKWPESVATFVYMDRLDLAAYVNEPGRSMRRLLSAQINQILQPFLD